MKVYLRFDKLQLFTIGEMQLLILLFIYVNKSYYGGHAISADLKNMTHRHYFIIFYLIIIKFSDRHRFT